MCVGKRVKSSIFRFMNLKIKYSLLVIVSFLALGASLFLWVPVKKGGDPADVNFGYPVSFVSQNFTQCPYFYVLPWYFKFNPSKDCPIKNISFWRLSVSFAIIFIFTKTMVFLLESLYIRLKN